MSRIELFVNLTVLTSGSAGGFGTATRTEVMTVDPDTTTRADIYMALRNQLPPEVRNGAILCFIVEPNRLGADQ